MKQFFTAILFFSFFQLSAQTTNGLIAHFSFDSCRVEEDFGTPNLVILENDNSPFDCDCGVKGQAIKFVKTGTEDSWFSVLGTVDDVFNTIDFTVSFYFKPISQSPENFVLMSRKFDCDGTDHAFTIRYNPSPNSRTFSVDMNESTTISGSISKKFPEEFCWYHVAVVRQGTTTKLYLNGEFVGQAKSTNAQRVDIANDNAILTVGASQCFQGFETPFKGFMDELRIYEKALSDKDIKELYFDPDQIGTGNSLSGTNDTTIFLGNSVQTFITNTCADNLLWSPTDGIPGGQEFEAEPLITPTQTTTYSLSFSDQFCTANDSLRITVIDPDDLDCRQLFVPKAFTPNTDGLNDTYGIDNPYVVNDLISFDIFDRWGNLVFSTDDPFARWDGTFKGQAVNSSVFLYKARWFCKGEEQVASGSVSLLR